MFENKAEGDLISDALIREHDQNAVMFFQGYLRYQPIDQ